MLRRAFSLCSAAALLAVTAVAQEQAAVVATPLDTDVVPARPGDEGALRYAPVLLADPADYVPAPMPVYSGVSTGPGDPVSIDLQSGVEHRYAADPGPFPSEQWVAGFDLGSGIREDLMRWWNAPTSVSSTAFPWSTQCRMFFTQSGGNYLCSGTLFDARNMITAGHCVHEGPGGTWSANVSIAPAWDGDADAYGWANAVTLATWTSWTGSGSRDGDQGYVRLDRPVGVLTGWLGYGYDDSTSWWQSTTMHMAAYPASGWAGAPNQLYYTWGLWEDIFTDTVESDVNWPYWAGGMSGGGQYWIDSTSGNRYVMSNMAYGWGKSAGVTTRIGGCRITGPKFSYMDNTWVPDSYPDTAIDLVPLDTQVDPGGSTIRAGEAPVSMSYLTFNMSDYDPVSATYYADVYLSTNDNISTFDTQIQRHYYNWDYAPRSTVRVNVPPPTIPIDTTPGSYWLGVILDVADYDTGNNDTDGWDAEPIQVIEPVDSILLQGPTSGAVGSWVTMTVSDAPPNSPLWLYWSRTLGGMSINGHPFDIGPNYKTVMTGTTDAAGGWSGTGRVPQALRGRTIYLEVRVDSAGYTYDSNYLPFSGY